MRASVVLLVGRVGCAEPTLARVGAVIGGIEAVVDHTAAPELADDVTHTARALDRVAA